MTAHYTIDGIPRSTRVWTEQREDGSMRPPDRFEIRETNHEGQLTRVYLLELVQFDVEKNVAVYRVAAAGGKE